MVIKNVKDHYFEGHGDYTDAYYSWMYKHQQQEPINHPIASHTTWLQDENECSLQFPNTAKKTKFHGKIELQNSNDNKSNNNNNNSSSNNNNINNNNNNNNNNK